MKRVYLPSAVEEYVKNFKNALDTLTRLQDENVKFSQFLAEVLFSLSIFWNYYFKGFLFDNLHVKNGDFM